MTSKAIQPGKGQDYWTAALLTAHVLALFAGFTILAEVFSFPEVLRLPAEARLAQFSAAAHIIIPTYWMLAMTGFSQILIAVLVGQSFSAEVRTLAMLSLIFGVLTGFGQALGFGRWAILVPWLAERMADPATSAAGREMLSLIEGSFNRYAGMLVGEHLSNIAWGFWLSFTGLAILKSNLFDRRLGFAMLLLGPVLWVLASEQLGYSSPVLGLLTDFGFPLLALIHFGLAWQFIRRKGEDKAPDLGVVAGGVGVLLYAGMIWPVISGQV